MRVVGIARLQSHDRCREPICKRSGRELITHCSLNGRFPPGNVPSLSETVGSFLRGSRGFRRSNLLYQNSRCASSLCGELVSSLFRATFPWSLKSRPAIRRRPAELMAVGDSGQPLIGVGFQNLKILSSGNLSRISLAQTQRSFLAMFSRDSTFRGSSRARE